MSAKVCFGAILDPNFSGRYTLTIKPQKVILEFLRVLSDPSPSVTNLESVVLSIDITESPYGCPYSAVFLATVVKR